MRGKFQPLPGGRSTAGPIASHQAKPKAARTLIRLACVCIDIGANFPQKDRIAHDNVTWSQVILAPCRASLLFCYACVAVTHDNRFIIMRRNPHAVLASFPLYYFPRLYFGFSRLKTERTVSVSQTREITFVR